MGGMRRRVLFILGITGGIVVLVLVAAAIAVATVDLNTLAEPLAARVRAATGRSLTLNGPIRMELSLEPTLRAQDVTLGNAPWGKSPAMIKAGRVEAQVALLPLLQRRFEIVRITLVDPVIELETDAQGRGNWLFGAPGEPASGGPEAAIAAAPALGIGEVEIRNGQVTYRDGVTGNVTPVMIEALTLRARDASAPISGEFRGTIGGVPVALKDNLGSRAMLQTRQWPYPVDVTGTIAGRSTKVQAKVTPQGGATRVDDFALVLGELAVQGSLTVDRSGPRAKYVVDLHLPKWVPEALALPAAASGAPASSVTPASPSRHLIPDQPIALGALRNVDAQGTVVIDTVALPHGQSLSQVRLRFALQDGRLDLTELAGAGLGGAVLARGVVSISRDAKTAALDVHAEGRDLALASLLAVAGAPREVSGGRTRLTLDGKASGASPHDWASTVDGQLVLLVGPAQLKSPPGSSTATLDQIGGAVNPFRATKGSTDLRCAVVRLPLHDGVARIEW